MSNNPTAKVVILNWNDRELLERFLPSVVANTPPQIGIVIADNGSEDDSVAFLQKEYPEVEILVMDRNYGFAGGYNRAIETISADYIILLNSDVETPPGWCGPLVGELAADTTLGAVSPKILSRRQEGIFDYAGAAGGFIDRFGYPFCRGRILDEIEQDRGQYDDRHNVFWTSGACMAVRKDVFIKCGGFDESFFAHMEEIDLCWRMQLYGYRLAVIPASKVFHLGGGTLSAGSPQKLQLNFRNNLAMMYKNLTRGMERKVFLRQILDGCSAAVYLVTGRGAYFKAVCRAHAEFRGMKPELKKKRAEIQSRVVQSPYGIYSGSIVWRYYTGRRTFGNLM